MRRRKVEYRDDRVTPSKILTAVRKLGPIGCDPCTSSKNPTEARFFYTLDSVSVAGANNVQVHGGLQADWTVRPNEVIYVHPPWTTKQLQAWLDAITANVGAHHIVALLPGSVTSKVMHRCMRESKAICWMNYRVKYGGDHGGERPSVLVYWGPDRSKFADAVRHLGPVFAAEEL